jgi:hypothetical protein
MSASYIGGKAEYTKRYHLGETVRDHCRHYLLLSATPHSGKQENFELFMALLDEDRFEGKPRAGKRKADTRDLMRRQVKEELYTFEGKPLFPERHAYTVKTAGRGGRSSLSTRRDLRSWIVIRDRTYTREYSRLT